jgi:DNA-3-methyladenine glycosylase I
MTARRCPWAKTELAIRYHDEEWGVPVRDERTLFEFLVLEGAQAGLSWDTILAKRASYREAFDGFDHAKIARYTPAKVESLVRNPGIVRHRGKIEAAITNARALCALHERGATLADTLWSVVGGRAFVNARTSIDQVPAKTEASETMSRTLKRLGFSFVGPTTCYALMQATGMVNDHLTSCPRHEACARLA